MREREREKGLGKGLKAGLSERGRNERCYGCRASNSRAQTRDGITWND